MKEQLRKYKEYFRWIAMVGFVPVLLCNNVFNIPSLGYAFFTAQIISFVIMFIVGWRYE